MKKETWKILLACALGAGIGSFISLEITSIYFIWVGIIAGGLIGYLSYNFRQVLAVIPVAYRAARGWQPDRLWWEAYFSAILMFTCLLSWIIPVLAILLISPGLVRFVLISSGILLILLPIFSLAVTTIPRLPTDKSRALLESVKRGCLQTAFCSAPPILIFYHLPRGIWWLMKRTPSAVWWVAKRTPHAIAVSAYFIGRAIKEITLFLGRFGWQMFIRIHSQKRLICGTDAMIGAGIGYLAGSALIGALAGALIGLVNYELVTRRWLIPKGHVKAPASAKS